MKELINEGIIPMVNDGLFSMKRIMNLIYIKEFIDRISSRSYLEDKDIGSIFQRFGVKPDVLTWGDYFQTELAISLSSMTDEEFDRALETVQFDMMAACIIFSGKDKAYFDWVEITWMEIVNTKDSGHTEDEKDIIHLKIMMDYYVNLGLIDDFTPAEKEWFSLFEDARVTSA